MTKRENWTSRISFILSAIGFAAGIGNLWRFPYLVGKYGGGVFLLFYLAIVTIIGIPLLSIEIALGKTTKKDPVGAYKKLAPKKLWFLNGYINILTIVLILGYASIVGGWIVGYFFKSAIGTFSGMAPSEITSYFASFISNPIEVIGWTVAFIAGIAIILLRGLNKGVEKVNKIMLPALFLVLIILIIRSLTLPGITKGLIFYFKPDISKFTLEGALAAIGQAFYSIGVAMTASLVYGSYLNKKEKIVSNAMIIGFADTLVAILAGLIIFPSVAAFGLEAGAGPGLTFITMPNVFNQIAFGNFFGSLFYLLFFLAAFTSFVGGAEGVIAHLRDEWGITRKKGVYITTATMLAIAIPSAISSIVFEKLDFFTNNYLIITGGLIMTIFVGWGWPMENFLKQANIKSKILRILWTFIIKFFAPLVIIIIGFMHN
jgi:neurotransmitter:Na+ symporter, NSS family